MRSLILIMFVPSLSLAMDLPEFLTAVKSKHRMVQALDQQKSAADLRNISGDISLVPVLNGGVFYVQDKNPLNQFAAMGATESKITDYNLNFSKKFATGTTLGMSADIAEYQTSGLPADKAFMSQFGTGSLGLSLSQSLWKDALGAGTLLRREQQNVATSVEKGRYDMQSQLLLVGAEQAYWSYIYALEAVKINRDSLERAKRIESWTKRRVQDGISEKADLLQTQALVSARELLLISGSDELAAATQSLRDYLELEKSEELPRMSDDISMSRPLESLIGSAPAKSENLKQKIISLDAYLTTSEAHAKSLAADQVNEAYKPDLTLTGAYQTHTFVKDLTSALENWTNTNQPTAKVSLNLNYMFDTDVKLAAQTAFKKDALSAKLISERKVLESESSWNELNRRNQELSKQIKIADQVTKIQDERAKAETSLFNKGRTITASVVNAEEDVGTAKLNLIRLKSAQRKMEAQGRLFVSVE